MKLNLLDLIKGIKARIEKLFYRPYSKFNISLTQEKLYKHANDNLKYTHIYKNKYKVNFEDPRAFLFSIKELFVDELYKFKSNTESPYIIDCGSYIGTSILYFKELYPNAKILGFEPDKKNYNICCENINNWKFENVEIRNAAIWTNNLGVEFINEGNMTSKISTENEHDKNTKQKVLSSRLKDLLNEHIDFLKIDIEGAEFEVLVDCENSLSNIDNLFIEYHANFDEMYKLNKILSILIENKFAYYIKEAVEVYKYPFYNRESNQLFNVQLNIFAFKQ